MRKRILEASQSFRGSPCSLFLNMWKPGLGIWLGKGLAVQAWHLEFNPWMRWQASLTPAPSQETGAGDRRVDGMSTSYSYTNKRDCLKNKVGHSLKAVSWLPCACWVTGTPALRHTIDRLTYTHHNLPPPPQSKWKFILEMGRPFQYCWLWGLRRAMQPSQHAAFPGESLHTTHN